LIQEDSLLKIISLMNHTREFAVFRVHKTQFKVIDSFVSLVRSVFARIV